MYKGVKTAVIKEEENKNEEIVGLSKILLKKKQEIDIPKMSNNGGVVCGGKESYLLK